MKLGTKIIAGFLTVVILTFMVAGASMYAVYKLNHTMDDMGKRAVPDLVKTARVGTNAAWQVASVRGFIITGNETFLKDFQRFNDESDGIIQELDKSAVTKKGKQYAQALQAQSDTYENLVKRVVALKREGRDEDMKSLIQREVEPAIKMLKATVDEYTAFRLAQTRKTLDQDRALGITSLWIVGVISMLSLIIGLVIGVVITRSVAKPIRLATGDIERLAQGDYSFHVPEDFSRRSDELGQMAKAMDMMLTNMRGILKNLSNSSELLAASSEEMTASAEQSAQAANQVASAITDVASGAADQLRVSEEATETIEQMSAGVQQISINVNNAAASAEETASAAKEGNKAVEDAARQMVQLEATVLDSAQVVAKLGERSKEIGQIVDTISGIAGQTNLLALNAAIEAARAGDQGRGFAVVAEEVRKLAEQSEEAAKQIATLIREIQADTEKAVLSMNEGTQEVKTSTQVVNAAGKSFANIMALVEHVLNEVKDISAAIQQMASSSKNVVSAIKGINQISKDTASQTQTVSAATEEQSASMQEIASSSQSLAKLAEELQKMVRQFKI